MPLPYQVINDRRIFCGRCRNERGQSRYQDGPFDSDTLATYHCGICTAVYAICRICARYCPDGLTCPYVSTHKDED